MSECLDITNFSMKYVIPSMVYPDEGGIKQLFHGLTCEFTSFSTVFQSYQDDERLIIKDCVQWNPLTDERISTRAGIELGTSRSVGQRLTY